MRTIGILGGLGPQATMDFEARLHRVAQQQIPQRGNTGLMEGREGPALAAPASQAVAALRARGVEGIVLGCTEIPLLLGGAADAPDLINPAQLLAEAAVRQALT